MKNSCFGDGIGWMWLRRVDNVAGHGGGEDNGAAGLVGDNVSASFLNNVTLWLKWLKR